MVLMLYFFMVAHEAACKTLHGMACSAGMRQSRATQPTVRAGCFGVFIIHRTLTRLLLLVGALSPVSHRGLHQGCSDMDYRMCAQMSVHTIAHGMGDGVVWCGGAGEGGADTVRESALKVDSGRKIACRTGTSNLLPRRVGPMLYQLSYILFFDFKLPWGSFYVCSQQHASVRRDCFVRIPSGD